MPTDPIKIDPGKSDIVVTINHDGTRYKSHNDKVRRVRHRKDKWVSWTFNNVTATNIVVTIHKFTPDCPLEKGDFVGGRAVARILAGHPGEVHGKFLKDAPGGAYRYVVSVGNDDTDDPPDDIDPELQLDNFYRPDFKVVLVAIAGSFLGYWLIRSANRTTHPGAHHAL